MVDKACACLLPRMHYCEGMRKSIFLKSFIIIGAGVAVVGGGVVWGWRVTPEVRGDTEPLELSETYTHPELVFVPVSPWVRGKRGGARGRG
jgi:hypothetical protein